ncbi:BON domain-containing protein [uncultured Nevskia sp.]|uniref:BON domain-containing protein n=1 Tax=uncultured Nevskia sp. TaxID=228950 RepID=UPI0025F19FB7|nr:BON domain-containing protein [uncultured Nevskia sp.]
MKTDAQLQADVIAELNWDSSINATKIGVVVSDGIVTLSGHVDSFVEKWSAERAAQRVAGVTAITVELEIELPDAHQHSDSDIARAVENLLLWSSFHPKESVKVMVENGWITLSGTLDWPYQRYAVANAVRGLKGITGVSNDIMLNPRGLLKGIKSGIEAALLRRSMKNLQNITIEVRDDGVTLSGNVRNWAEHDAATGSAWGTAGVRRVIDHITVTG